MAGLTTLRGSLAFTLIAVFSTPAAADELGPDTRHRDPDDPQALVEERPELEKKLAAGELDASGKKRLIAARHHAGSDDDALTLARTLVARRPEDDDARRLLASLLDASGELEEAARQYGLVLRARPDDALVHLDLGIVHRRREDFDRALEHYGRALSLAPELAVAHFDRGEALLAKDATGLADAAIEAFRKAIELSPSYARPYVALGKVYADLGFMEIGRAHV